MLEYCRMFVAILLSIKEQIVRQIFLFRSDRTIERCRYVWYLLLVHSVCELVVISLLYGRKLLVGFTVCESFKPPSHQPRSHYVLQKLGGRSKNFVQRSRNAVETHKGVIWSS